MEINISTRSDGKVPVTVFQIHGSLDVQTHRRLEETAKEEFEKGTRYLILDLTDVNYITSAGLRAIHTVFNLFRSGDATENDAEMKKGIREGVFKSHHLKLAHPSKMVQQVITTAGYDMFLEIHPNVDQAVHSF